MKSFDRREFIKTFVVGSAGFLLATKVNPFSAFAQVPWQERTDSTMLDSSGVPGVSRKLVPSRGFKNEYPAIDNAGDDTLWTCWTEELPGGEVIRLSPLRNETFGKQTTVNSEPSYSFQPEILAYPGGGIVAWTQFVRQGEWHVKSAFFHDSSVSSPMTISGKGSIAWRPCIVRTSNGAPWILWEEKSSGKFQVKARRVSGDTLSPIITVSASRNKDNCRPTAVATKGNTFWVAWDRCDDNGNINVVIRHVGSDGTFLGDEIPVTRTHGLDVAPSLAVDSENLLWVGWHSNRWGKEKNQWDVPRWFQLYAYDGHQFKKPVADPPGKSRKYKDTIQSFEFVNLHSTNDGKIVITGRASHNFYLQYYRGSRWSELFRLPKDGWGGRGQYLEVAEDRDGTLWVARRDLGTNVFQSVTLPVESQAASPVLQKVKASPRSVNIPNAPQKPVFEPWKGYDFYFGDIHGHTWMSDGVGDVDEYYIARRDFYKLDFASLTDHDTFVGNGLLPSEWEQIKELTSHFNEPGSFVTLYGQEWTTARYPQAFGHKNIYHINPALPLFDHTDEGTETTQQLFEKVKNAGAIAIPHHIGWTGVDWEHHDPVVQPLVEIVSVHGAFEYMGNQPIYHRGGKKGCFVQDGLARGLRFGIIGSTDSHGLIWHHRVCYKRDPNRAGWTGVLAKDLSRESIWEALKARRCYATSGIWVRMVFAINDHPMGEEFETSEKPSIKVDINSESELKWIEIVRNNKTLYTYGGEGCHSWFTYKDEDHPGGVSWYYLRVICEDGNMAWSSPIWVTYSA